jgi:hypothetical protein
MGMFSWPARSPDLSACVCFLCRFLKSNIYIRIIAKLKQNIREEIAAILVEMTWQVMGNWCYRIQQCVQKDGSHLNDIILKK